MNIEYIDNSEFEYIDTGVSPIETAIREDDRQKNRIKSAKIWRGKKLIYEFVDDERALEGEQDA